MKNLLKKELSELLNKQMLISLVVSFVLILALGMLMTGVVTGEIEASGTLHIIDQDKTAFTQQIMERLEEKGYIVETGEDFKTMAAAGWNEAVLLPEGMTAAFERHESCALESYTSLKTTSTVTITVGGEGSMDAVNGVIRELLTEEYLGEDDLEFLNAPTQEVPYTYANGTLVQANAFAVVTSLAMFDQVMPMVLFLLVVLTAQTIITAIASEKMDKTLETLLSSPVPRTKIIGAKMLAAVIVAVIYAAVYGLGFLAAMMLSVGGGNLSETMDVGAAFSDMTLTRQAVQTLGLQIPAYGWIGVIGQLVLTLCIALTAAIILGALVEDTKNAQSASLPIMLCTMFPYLLSMVSDIRNMEGGVKLLMMAIPFTHTFIATSCLRFHDYLLFWGGMAYQAVFLGVLVWAALRLYSSDVLFVHSRKYRTKKNAMER